MTRPLYPHQIKAIDGLRNSLRAGHKRPVLQAPTGAGKTLIAAAIIEMARAKGNRLIFTVPAISLVDQTVTAFWREGITDVGVIQANHEMTHPGRPVQVASIQTLMRRPIPSAELVVVDECHRVFDFYRSWMALPEWEKVPFIGLSATPWTKGLGRLFDDLIIAATTQELIDLGHLSSFEVYAPSHPDLSGVRTVAGDYHEGDLSKALDRPALTADVVETWREKGDNRPTLVFAVDRAHARHLEQQFDQAGVRTGYIDAYTPLDERDQIRKQFHSGDIKVVCNVGCLTMGVDWDVRCIVLARPTKSEILFVQMIGRGLRMAEGKSNLRILDHSDTHLRLGFVTDIHHDKLDGGPLPSSSSSERKEPLPKECSQCSFLKPARLLTCPVCGHVTKPMRELEAAEGELKRLSKKADTFPPSTFTKEAKIELYGQLKRIGLERGYAPGWADNKYRTLVGKWPNYYRDVPDRPPSEQLLKWVLSQTIRYQKGRAKRQGQPPEPRAGGPG